VLVATDGVLDALGRGKGSVGEFIRELCRDPSISPHDFAAAVDFSRETFDDDRTLVAIWVS
jgi:hypothetical protein